MAKAATPTTIDERNLTVKCDSLASEEVGLREKLAEIKDVCAILKSIQRPDGEAGTKPPIDERTSLPVSDALRLQIYNAYIPKADRLLGLIPDDTILETKEADDDDED